MAFFKSKGPKLPSFVDISLDGLRNDPAWTQAARKAGWDLDNCEFVWRVDQAMVGTGLGSVPTHVRPALVLGHGSQLAIVFPTEREVRVVSRSKAKAELQTQRSGHFQILFGSVEQMDVWMFDGLQKGTQEGERFGQTMLRFLEGRLAPDGPNSSPGVGAAAGGSSSGVTASSALPDVTPELLAQARDFMEEWTYIVGQASDPVFWGALGRFGRIGGAVQSPNSQAMFERPWRTWIEISRKATEIGDFELAARVFFFAYTIVNQVSFDAEVSAVCGFQHPSDESYREIARHALVAANLAPDDFTVVERSTENPVPKQGLQLGLAQLLGIDPSEAVAVQSSEAAPQASAHPNVGSSLAGATVSAAGSGDVDTDTLHGLLHQLAGTCGEVMRLHGACDEAAQRIQKAHRVLEMPQAPESRNSFRGALERYEREFSSHIDELRTEIGVGQTLWHKALTVSGAFDSEAGDQGMSKLLMSVSGGSEVQAEEISSIMVGGLFLKVDFGSTLESFYAADRWLAQVMGSQSGS